MAKSMIARLGGLLGLLLAAGSLVAAEGGSLRQAGNDLGDRASLQRGAQLYMNYCSACHSLKYLRYSRMAADLGLSEQEVMTNLNPTGAKFGEHIQAVMPVEGAVASFGKAPPDLSLIARVRGGDWLYTYLHSFYPDSESSLGWNNALFANVSMPNPFAELQGLQEPVRGAPDPVTGERSVTGLRLVEPGTQKPQEFDGTVRDIVNFLEYAGEPAALQRRELGAWVLGFLAVLTLLAYLVKREYWKDVH